MNPAAKHFDPILGIDIHIIQPPGPVPPVPIPHPFVGFLFDAMEYIPISIPVPIPFVGVVQVPLNASVKVNGMLRAIAGTMGKTVPGVHFPIGGTFVKPPSNECEMFMGSSTVNFDGDAASYMGLPALECQCIGAPPIPRLNIKKKSKVKSLVLPTGVVLPIPLGPPVLIGGPPTISLMAIAVKVGFALARKLAGAMGKGIRALQRRSKAMAALSQKLSGAAKPGSWRAKAACFLTGHPVDVATGRVLTDHVDIELPGPMPFRWERSYHSASPYNGPLGHRWHHSYDLALRVVPEAVVVRLGDGRYAAFPKPTPEQPGWDPEEKLLLHSTSDGYVMEDDAGLRYHFGPATGSSGEQPLMKVRDPNGNTIQFLRSGPRLTGIIDSASRRLEVRTDRDNRIVGIAGPDPDQPNKMVDLVTYRYDADDDLVEVRDALGNPFRYAYRSHLLMRETDRNGVSFYFEYDGAGPNAHCLHTWGDGGVYSRTLSYDNLNQRTTVIDSRGGTFVYDWNDQGLVTRETDALGSERHAEWDENAWKLSETDACGATSSYEYDDQGRVIAMTGPMGQRTEYGYDEAGNEVSITDALGNVWRREYDERRNLTAEIDPAGHRQRIDVDEHGLPTRVTDPLGRTTQLTWSESGELQFLVDRTGAKTVLTHDSLGRLVRRTDGNGAETRLSWDLCGQLTAQEEPRDRRTRFEYDPEGNLVGATDPLGRLSRYGYGPRGRLAWAQDPSGATRRYRYDAEMSLIEAQDARGRVWCFNRDIAGRLVEEVTFDGRQWSIDHDAESRPIAYTNARGQRVVLERDLLGQPLVHRYPDGTVDRYEYDSLGRLIRARNQAAVLGWEYDAAGHVVAKQINGEVLRIAYDAAGNRLRRESPFGRVLEFDYDSENRLSRVRDQEGDLLRLMYDPLGREVHRQLPGGISHRREYLVSGELHRSSTHHEAAALASREYRYDPAGQMIEFTDGVGVPTRFEHDLAGRLTTAIYPDKQVERFLYDMAGNVPGIPEGGDPRVGDVLETKVDDWRLRYDEEGNLIEKRGPEVWWQYGYDAAGRLSQVWKRKPGASFAASPSASPELNPGELLIQFGYDPLGRRVSKKVSTPDGETSRVDYLWDDDVLLGERRQEAVLGGGLGQKDIEYLFRPESFEPLAKFGSDGASLMECDHLATPRAAYGRDGRLVWRTSYDAFGAVRQELGQPGEVPFRFPGQYEDPETGLYYNRFRYYDPALRRYTSPDPIGLAGGFEQWNYVPNPTSWVDPLGLNRVCYDRRVARFRDKVTGRFVQGQQVHGHFPHTVNPGQPRVLFRRSPINNQVTHYHVYNNAGLPMKRVDITGAAHGGVLTPHVLEFTHNTRPGTPPQTFANANRMVRPATAEDLL